MFPFLQIGPLALQVPGLLLLLGLWLGLTLAERHAPRYGVNGNSLYNLVFIGLVSGVVGARLAYVFRYPGIFAGNPASLVSLNPGLLDLWGGMAAGVISALVYGQRKKIPFWPALDALTPVFAVLAAALSLANLASGAAFGAPADLPWAIELWGAPRHPTQVYHFLAAAAILWIVWPGRGPVGRLQAGENGRFSGIVFLSFVALSAGASLFLEAFRGDSSLLPGGLRSAQVIAWFVLAASLWGLGRSLAGRSAVRALESQP